MLKTRFKIRSTYAVNAYAFEGIYTYQQWCCKREQCNEARHRWECHQWTWTFWCWIDQLMNRHFVQLAMMDRLNVLIACFFHSSFRPVSVLWTGPSSCDQSEFLWPVWVTGIDQRSRDQSDFVRRVRVPGTSQMTQRVSESCWTLVELKFVTFDRALIFDNVIFHVSISIVMWCTPAMF